jgi:hypothetical protein
LVWVIVTGVSGSVSLVTASVVAEGASLALSRDVSLAISGVVGGTVLGLAQWLFLRPAVKGLGAWALATTVGWLTGLVVAALVVRMANLAWGGIIGGTLGGWVFGLTQWLALRPDGGRRGEWLLVTAVGWSAALIVGMTLLGVSSPNTIRSGLVGIAVSEAVGGVVMGIVAIVVLISWFPKTEKPEADVTIRWWPDHR